MFKKLSDIFNDSNYKKSNFKNYKINSTPDVIDFHILVNDWEEIVGEKITKDNTMFYICKRDTMFYVNI